MFGDTGLHSDSILSVAHLSHSAQLGLTRVQDLQRTCCKAGSQPDVLAQLQSRLLAKISAAGKLR